MCIYCLLQKLGLDPKEVLVDEDVLKEMFGGGDEEEKRDPAADFKMFMNKVVEAGPHGKPSKKKIAEAVTEAESSARNFAKVFELLKKANLSIETMKILAQAKGATDPAKDLANIQYLLKTIGMNRAMVGMIAENARIVKQRDKKRYKFEMVIQLGDNDIRSDLTISVDDAEPQAEGGSVFD